MPPDKHLVLDPDVHEKLKSKKRGRGSTLREIGNTILRSALDRPALSDAIARKLIEEGRITFEDYRRAKEGVFREHDAFHRHIEDLLEQTDRGTSLSGSWEASLLVSGAEKPYQVLEAWAIDAERTAVPLHCHDASDEFFVVIEGQLLVTLDEEEKLLEEGEIDRVPAGQPHAVTPLTDTTRILAICCPPDPGFEIGGTPASS